MRNEAKILIKLKDAMLLKSENWVQTMFWWLCPCWCCLENEGNRFGWNIMNRWYFR